MGRCVFTKRNSGLKIKTAEKCSMSMENYLPGSGFFLFCRWAERNLLSLLK